MLTPADIKRPDVLRLNRIINSVTAIVWFPLAVWRKVLFGIFSFFDWLFDSSFPQAMEFRDWLLAAYVKRWPTPLQPGDPLYAFSQSREMPDTACKVVKFRRYSEPFAERPGDIDSRDDDMDPVPLPGSAEFWAAIERRDHLNTTKHPL